jgi:DNA-binding transcriptional LysR family regulator
MQATIPAFKALRKHQPGLSVNFNISNDVVSLDKGEADIALRITSTPPEHLVAVPLLQVSAAAYVHPSLLKEQGLPLNSKLSELTDKLDWISWRRSAGDIDIAEAIREIIGEENIKYSVDSGTALMDALQGGLGAGFMMTSSVAREHDLVEIEGSRQELPLKFWLLYHPNSRPSPKIRAAVDCLREQFCRS